MRLISLFLSCTLFGLIMSSCQETSQQQISRLLNKHLVFDDGIRSIKDNEIVFTPDSNRDKIILYVDSFFCLTCNLNYTEWNDFQNTILELTNNRIQFAIIFHPSYDKKKVQQILEGTDLELYCDENNAFIDKKLRDYKYRHCFFLNEENQIILIGNPILNKKLKELYIRTICERLGIERPQEPVESQRTTNSLGVFNWQTEQHTSFVVNNDSDEPMHIDSLYTSCECTTASINKADIAPHDKAIVNVTFKADRPEQFMREIYADLRGGEQIVMVIEGEAIE